MICGFGGRIASTRPWRFERRVVLSRWSYCVRRANTPAHVALVERPRNFEVASSSFDMSKPRTRYAGTASDLAEVLTPFATKPGFVKYDEAGRVADAKIHHKYILDHGDMLDALRQAQENLSFTKTLVTAALDILIEKKFAALPDEEKKYMASTICKRLRNMCRAVMQAARKKHPPPWLQELPWNRAAQGERDAIVPATSTDKTYVFGYSPELKQAWRAEYNKPHLKEASVRVFAPEGAADTDPAMAAWADGCTHPVSDITVAELATSIASSSTCVQHPWTGEHVISNHRLHVALRKDRTLLASLYEQNKQILQTRVDSFGDHDSESEASQQAAISFMIEVGKEYSENRIQLHELKSFRDERMKTMKCSWPTKGSAKLMSEPSSIPRKRPASSTCASPSNKKQALDVGDADSDDADCESEDVTEHGAESPGDISDASVMPASLEDEIAGFVQE